MAEVVYALCAATGLLCFALLIRSYRSNGARLLLWASLCFAGLALNNVLLFVDLVIVPAVDLSVLRGAIALIAMSLLLVGLVWEST